MITVNGEKEEYVDGLTVSILLEKKKFIFPMLVIRVNGKLVERERYESTPIADNDVVEVIHMISGG